MMRVVDYLIYDVFTDRALSGNPLAVVLNADGLSDASMQAIAREFNLSETIFFFAAVNPQHSANVRIFMPIGELPFAGHPTIGGSIAFAAHNKLKDNTLVVLEEGVGPVQCMVSATSHGGHSSFVVPRLSQVQAFNEPIEKVSAALGLEVADIGFDRHEVSGWSAGVPYVMVPVKDISVLTRLALNAQDWLNLDVKREGKIAAAYIYAPDPSHSGKTFRARMFAPWDGMPEDPATGSAVAAFSGAVWKFENLHTGTHEFIVRQGVEMGRPSRISLRVDGAGGSLISATISGEAVKIAEGKLFLPD